MNRVILMGRLTRDPNISYSGGSGEQLCTARYTLAVDRRMRKDANGENTADFISCVSWGKTAEFVEKYLKQGTKVVAEGRILTGSYTNKEGQKVYTTDVVVENLEFAESKATAEGNTGRGEYTRPTPMDASNDGFMNIADGVEDEGLPFN